MSALFNAGKAVDTGLPPAAYTRNEPVLMHRRMASQPTQNNRAAAAGLLAHNRSMSLLGQADLTGVAGAMVRPDTRSQQAFKDWKAPSAQTPAAKKTATLVTKAVDNARLN